MFDRFVRRTKSPRWKTALILGTAAGHAAVISALVLVAFWKIDPLPVVDHADVKLGPSIPKDEAGGPPPGARLKVQRPAVAPRIKPPVPVQPPPIVPPDLSKAIAPAGDVDGTGTPGGGGTNPGGDPTSELTGTGTCAAPPCGPPEPPPAKDPLPPDPDPPIAVVPPTVAAGLRLSGNDALYPSDPVRLSILRDGKDQVRGTFKLCVSRGGAVDAVQLIQSTGYDAYDAELTRAIRAWTFRPYLVNGKGAPMCTVKVVLFRLKR
jgi:TonB family protein